MTISNRIGQAAHSMMTGLVMFGSEAKDLPVRAGDASLTLRMTSQNAYFNTV